MRRSTRLGLLIGVPLLVVVLGGYTVFWFIAAGRMEQSIGPLAQSLQAQNLDLSWRTARVRGFPLAFRVELTEARLRDRGPAQRGDVRAPSLSASAHPWNFHLWRLAAPDGLSAATASGDLPAARLSTHSADGTVVVDGEGGGATLWVGLEGPALDAGVHVAARQAYLRLTLPARPPQSHTEPAVGLTLDLVDLSLPFVPPPLHNPLDTVSFGVRVLGRIPDGPARQAAAAWRDDGGIIELDYLALHWDTLAVRASGTLALDGELQLAAALSGGIAGYPELMRALVAAGRIRRSDAGIADMALALLARTGPDGRPEIGTAFTIQDGQMFLGPAKLGPAPHIAW